MSKTVTTMEQNEDIIKTEKKEQKAKRELTPQELQKRKKLIIFPIMILAFIGSLWLIFAPSIKKEESDKVSTFNAELPLPGKDEILSDKKKAYEQEDLRIKHQERMRTLQDFGFDSALENSSSQEDENSNAYYNQDNQPNQPKANNSPIYTSANKYQQINRQLENFYEGPAEDLEKEELFERVTELETRLRESETMQSSTEEQLTLLEKSYELAAKYINNNQGQTATVENIPMKELSSYQQGKSKAVPVKAVEENVVSGLQQSISDEAFIEAYSKPRNSAFHTAITASQSSTKNTILACIHEDQSVMDGQNVKLRLLEPLQAGTIIIPKNTLLTGMARIQRERLDIDIVSIEYNGSIISVELNVYDSDGQKGLATPSTLEMQSLTEGAANMGAGLGSSFTINQNAGSAI
ncbi:MAG: conjugative transposon protein TraM, partial [Dysgonamonadaceae bacterium]